MLRIAAEDTLVTEGPGDETGNADAQWTRGIGQLKHSESNRMVLEDTQEK